MTLLVALLAWAPVALAGPAHEPTPLALDRYPPLSEAERAAVIEGLRTDSPEMAAFVAMPITGPITWELVANDEYNAKARAFEALRASLEARAAAEPGAVRPIVALQYAAESFGDSVRTALGWEEASSAPRCLPALDHHGGRPDNPGAPWLEVLTRARMRPDGGMSDPEVRYAVERLRILAEERAASQRVCEAEAAAALAARKKTLEDLRAELARLEGRLREAAACPSEASMMAEMVAEQARAVLTEDDAEIAASILAFVVQANADLAATPCP